MKSDLAIGNMMFISTCEKRNLRTDVLQLEAAFNNLGNQFHRDRIINVKQKNRRHLHLIMMSCQNVPKLF